MSLFGAANPKPVTGLFGSTQPSQPSGGLFGSTNTNQQQSTSGGFGSLQLGQPQSQQQQQGTGGSLFGGGQAQPAQGGGLFGGAGGGAFGSSGAGTGSSIFGNPNPNASGNTAGTGGVGNTNPNSGNPGGGLFGSTTGAAPATSSMFGQPPAASNPSPFGQQPQQQQQGSSIFGSLGQPQNQSQNQNPTQSQAPGFGSFNLGQPQTSTNQGGGSGLFASAAPPFGASSSLPTLSQPASTSSLFGPKPAVPLSTSSLLPGGQSHQPSDNSAQAQSSALQHRIEGVVAAWSPQSPQCRFQHYFYNLVDPRQVAMYGRPANATNDALWQQAVRENPDPSCMVPALAVGFDDLNKRVEAQSNQAALHQEKLKELQTRLSTLSQTHLLSNTLRTTRALQTYTLITHRLLRLIEHIHLLIPSLRSAAISPEEEALRAKLDRLKDEVQRGLGGGGGRGRVNELWALLGAVKAAKERDTSGGRDGVEWKVVDQEGFERLAMILAEQQQGLAHLTNIINNDMKDLQILEGGGGGETGVGGNSLHRGQESASPGLSKSSSGLLPGRR